MFDGSGHSPTEPSINDVSYSGIRFSTGKIVIAVNVKQAFLQVEVVKEYRDFLIFLWFKDILYNQ